MPSKLVLSLSIPENPIKAEDDEGNLSRLIKVLKTMKAGAGTTAATIDARFSATAASGTVTLAACAAADTVTINGLVFTASSTPAGEVQFEIDGDDTADAAALAAKINACTDTKIAGVVTASSALGVVTITAVVPGLSGNAITLASSNGTRAAVSGARLTGGAETRESMSF